MSRGGESHHIPNLATLIASHHYLNIFFLPITVCVTRAHLCAVVMDPLSDALAPSWTRHLASADSPSEVPGISWDCQADVSLDGEKNICTQQ